MASRSVTHGPESGDAPSFTCEVCKISVRSAQKLLDHVNFSPLHKAALEGGVGPHSPTKGRSGMRRILYDGTKLFWRINETLELCIHEDTGANCITVTAAPQDQQHDASEIKVAPLLLDRRSVIRGATEDGPHAAISERDPQSHTVGYPTHAQAHPLVPDVINKYLLARLQAKRSGNNVSLFLQKLRDDEFEPIVLSLSHHLTVPAAHLATRRRHTYDEVKTAQKHVKEAAVELKNARMQAETLSNLARVTLEAFSKRTPATAGNAGSSRHDGNTSHKSEWLRVYDRIQFKNAVEHSKGMLGHPQPHDRK